MKDRAWLRSRAEQYVVWFLMRNPHLVSEFSAYWFTSLAGSAIVWAIIKSKGNANSLEEIKSYLDCRNGKVKDEWLDLIWNQPEIDGQSLQYTIKYFKTVGKLLDLFEASLERKCTISARERTALQGLAKAINEGHDQQRVWQAVDTVWRKKLGTKTKWIHKSTEELVSQQQRNEEELLKKLDNK